MVKMAEDGRWREKKLKRQCPANKEKKSRAFYYTMGQRSRGDGNSVRLQRSRELKKQQQISGNP